MTQIGQIFFPFLASPTPLVGSCYGARRSRIPSVVGVARAAFPPAAAAAGEGELAPFSLDFPSKPTLVFQPLPLHHVLSVLFLFDELIENKSYSFCNPSIFIQFSSPILATSAIDWVVRSRISVLPPLFLPESFANTSHSSRQ